MVIQLLGVTLISLLTITPILQQNKPNIEIQPLITTNNLPTQVYIQTPFDLYLFEGASTTDVSRVTSFDFDLPTSFQDVEDAGAKVLLDPNVNGWEDTDLNGNIDSGAIITSSNFFIFTTDSTTMTGNQVRKIITEYYTDSRGLAPTSLTVSFSQTTQSLTATSTFYTYTATNSTTGDMTGRVYYQAQSRTDTNSGSITNNNITVPQGTTLQNVINSMTPTATLENPSMANSLNQIILYYFNQPIPLDTVGTYTRTLYSRTNYLRNINHGTFTINVTSNDTTPPVITGPTSLTFEVGTYQLIEQILNNFYTITDEPNDDWDWNIIGSYNLSQVGTYNISIRAFDTANNETIYPIQLNITAPPPNDTTPPVITGSDTITRELGQINNDGQLINQFIVTDDITLSSAINKTLTGTRSYTQSGTYNLTLTATDQSGNIATKQFTFIINPPVIDNEPPVIISDLIVSITIGDFTDRQEILDFYTTVTDNIALSSVLLVGDINFNVVGDYQLQIIATDTSQNQSTRNILVRIKDEVILGNYNPLTDLLSGIFGAALSMVFTIGTVNVLGLRLLDAMGVIILGAVLLFIYKAIKGGS
jgi:hypothetical protein